MIKIGTCGYGCYNPGKNWKERYKSKLQAYSVCELNRTFYKLPMRKTAEQWRQAITHPVKSR